MALYVLYLRRKLATPDCCCSIRTTRGVGYALIEEQLLGAPEGAKVTPVLTRHLDG